MNLTQFFLKYNGKRLDYDGVWGPQCVDTIKAYFKQVLNRDPIQGDAIDYWRDIPGFTRIAKTWYNAPQPGDIVVWGTSYGPYGHIALINWSRLFDFGAFSQNDPKGSPCAYKDYSYKHVLGWLRPEKAPVGPDPFIMKFTAFNANSELLEEARNLMMQYSGGKINISFDHRKTPEIITSGLYTYDQQIQFLKDNFVNTPFVFLNYTSTNTPNYDYMSTNEVSGKILVQREGSGGAFLICYEFAHAIQKYARLKGFQQSVDDIYTPNEDFLKKKLQQVIPLVGQLV